MVACCAHHLSDVLPIIGLTGAALFFSDYQKIFLLLGVLSNVVGITLMLHMIQRHGLMEKGHLLFERIFRWDMGKVFRWNIGLSIVLFTIVVMAKAYGHYF
jgi:xanthine/uracil permease